MTTSASKQYHFSQEQRAQLGQVYRLILGWRQERLAAQARQAGQSVSSPDAPMESRLLIEDGAERSEA